MKKKLTKKPQDYFKLPKKAVAIGVIIILLLGGVSTALVVRSNQQQQAKFVSAVDWSTNTDAPIPYTFRYPQGWTPAIVIDSNRGKSGVQAEIVYRDHKQIAKFKVIYAINSPRLITDGPPCAYTPKCKKETLNTPIGEAKLYWSKEPSAKIEDGDNVLTFQALSDEESLHPTFRTIISTFRKK